MTKRETKNNRDGQDNQDNDPLIYFKQAEPEIFRFWEILSEEQKRAFEKQLSQINIETLKKQRELLENRLSPEAIPLEPFDDFAFSGNQENERLGEELIKQGRVGCLLLAGGQGTRLQYSGAKGTYPISIIKNKSLFQLCAEKVGAASAWADQPLRLAIMTSPENDAETRSFFQQNDYFSLQPSQVSFFMQESLPFLDSNGRLILKSPWELSMGPDGNGNSLLSFAKSGIMDDWIRSGIEYMQIILVDNPLAVPFDAELGGFHQKESVEITLKCTEKIQGEEKVGVAAKQNGRCTVVEYSEISESEKNERRKDGRLKHCCANLSLFCFSLSFIKEVASKHQTLPLHRSWKAAQWMDEKGNTQLSSKPIAWKFETYIFDWLFHARKVAALLYPREQCFAPLKNFTGPDSPETVKQALQQREKQILQNLTELPPPSYPFELAAEFYYPAPALVQKWKRRHIESPYVE